MNDDICASLQMHPGEIKYLDFSLVRKGGDVDKQDLLRYSAQTECTTNIHISDKKEKEFKLAI